MSIPLQARSGAWQPALELLEPISLVRCCTSPLGRNLCMIVTETAVHVYATSDESPNLSFEPVTSFFLGCRATGASWSPSTQHASTAWRIEILVATETNELRLLESVRQGSEVSTSSKKLADTHARVSDLAWCASAGYESYAAAACADGTVRLWDLEGGCRTHYLNSAVLSVAFHPKVPKLLLAMESSGVGYLLDWLASDGELRTAASFHEPVTLGAHATQHYEAQGAAAWQAQDADMVGALLGSRWCVWNVHEASVPVASGQLHLPSVHGGLRFCPTNSRLFAVFAHGSMSPAVHIFDSAFPASPRSIDVHAQTPFRPGPVSLDTTGAAGTAATLPSAYGARSIDWMPRRMAAYDVLLVGVGRHLVPIPVA